MSLTEGTAAVDLLELREQYVARGVATPRLVVVRAEGAQVEAADGRVYLDFAGGIACQNTGHGFASRRRCDPRAGRPVPAPVLHGRELRAVRGGVPAAGGALAVHRVSAEVGSRQQRRGGGRECRQDRARGDGATGRRRLRERLPRAHPPDDGDDLEGAALQGRLRPVPGGGAPGGRAVPVSRHRHRGGDRCPRAPFQERGRRRLGRVRRARDRPGRGRLHPDAARLPAAAGRDLRAARDPLRRRRGAVRRRPHGPDVGGRALRGREAGPPRLREVARRRPSARGRDRPRRAHGRARPRRARRHLRRQPGLVRRGRGRARHGRRALVPRPRRRARADAPEPARPDRRGSPPGWERCGAWARCWPSSSASGTPSSRSA